MMSEEIETVEHQVEQGQQQGEQQGEDTSLFKNYFNGINSIAGVGILSIPYAVSQGGWISICFLFAIAVLGWYTGLLLKYCMDVNPNIRTYPDIGEHAFGYIGKTIITILIFMELYLVAVECLILGGDNLNKLFPNMSFKIGSLKIGGSHGFIILTALVILPTTWLKNLGSLAYISAGGVFASFALVISIFWIGEVEGIGFHERGKLLDLRGIPSSISLFTFCYGGHPVFPTIIKSMSDRSRFPKVLLICFIISTVNYAIMACQGYLMFGEHIESQVTLNLPEKKISTQIAIYITLFNPIAKYALLILPIAEAIEDRFLSQERRLLKIIMRTLMVISTVIIALAVPFFGYVMVFIGAFLSITASILLPCILYLKIYESARKCGVILVINIGIIMFGSYVGVMGTYTAIREIVNHL